MGTNGTFLDIYLVRNVNISKPYILNELSSDHQPVITYFNPNNNNNDKGLMKLDYTKTNWQTYRNGKMMSTIAPER